VTLDLTGLLPSIAEAMPSCRFVPDAYEQVVDRLLASTPTANGGLDTGSMSLAMPIPRFMEVGSPRPARLALRDYVIRAFNADKSWKGLHCRSNSPG